MSGCTLGPDGRPTHVHGWPVQTRIRVELATKTPKTGKYRTRLLTPTQSRLLIRAAIGSQPKVPGDPRLRRSRVTDGGINTARSLATLGLVDKVFRREALGDVNYYVFITPLGMSAVSAHCLEARQADIGEYVLLHGLPDTGRAHLTKKRRTAWAGGQAAPKMPITSKKV